MKKILFSTLLFILYSSVVYSQTPCQAMFTYSGTGGSPNIILFTDSSIIGGNPIFSTVSYFWDFGDNSMDTVQNPIHTYINNGIYYSCLTIIVVDPNGNACTSVYCDSILIGNTPPTSWDCDPITGCYNPGTGNGQYTTLVACQSACAVTPSWDCSPNAIGCYDPGTGNGQYATLAACQSACAVTPSWDCDPVNGCYDPGTGNGQYATLNTCQSNCSSTTSNYCDSVSISISGSTPTSVTYTTLANPFINSFLYSFDINWNVTNFNTGAFITSDTAYNPTFTLNNLDTILVCATAIITGQGMTFTCILCDTILYNSGWIMMSMGQTSGLEDVQTTDRQLLKVISILGRETKGSKNQPLFYIYDDGTVEKKIIIE
jgi:PKD repeat protein